MATSLAERAARRAAGASRVARLEHLRLEFGSPARAEKPRVLRALAARPPGDPTLFLRLHETLCFMRAYPDDPSLLRQVEALLGAVPAWVAGLPAGARRALEESGVAGTTISCPLSYAAARWLVGRFAEAVELDWTDEETEATVLALLPFAVPGAAEETLVEVGVSARAWLGAARAHESAGAGSRRPTSQSDAAWLLGRLGRGANGPAGRAVYDQVQPRLAWRLGDGPGSRTFAVAPAPSPHFQRRPLDRRRPAPSRRGSRTPVQIRRARRAEALALVDLARSAVTVRYREVHAFNGADPGDVVVADLGRGLAVAWIGLRPDARLPLRAHYGYLLLKNGVPVGYGDASCLFEWCEIAFNVFGTFRGGESAFAFVRLLDFVGGHLGIETFLLNPYQLGKGNDEALDSGAFWFYAKLGFVPLRPDLARLARAERRRLRGTPGARSSVATLARLAEGYLGLAIGRRLDPGLATFDTGRLARRATASERGGARASAVARFLGAGPSPRTLAERQARARLAPLLGAIPDFDAWSAADRAELAALVRAKAGATEREYLRRLRRHSRLRSALLQLGAQDGAPVAVSRARRPGRSSRSEVAGGG